MFDISPMELLTIALVALIVFGPHRLPEISRKVGKYLGEIRRAASDLTSGLEREVRDLQEPFQDLKEDLTKPITAVKESLDETSKGIADPLKEVGDSLKGVSSGGPADQPEPGAVDEPTDEAAVEPGADSAGAAASVEPETETTGPRVTWVAPEPETGVSPADSWKGLDDEVPAGAQTPAEPEGSPAQGDQEAPTGEEPAGEPGR
jgi:sec-independent protein translocase protein TatB